MGDEYFEWTTAAGGRIYSDTPPGETDETIVELIFHRSIQRLLNEGLRKHMSFPIHEETVKHLPRNLRVLRLTGCRIRTTPNLPTSLVELYAEECDYIVLSTDFRPYAELIVLEFGDGRLERWTNPLPPNLARMNLNNNALELIEVHDWPTTLNEITAFGNPSRLGLRVGEYRARVRADDPYVQFIRGVAPNAPRDPFVRRQDLAALTAQKPKAFAQDTQNIHTTGVQQSADRNIQYLNTYLPLMKYTDEVLLEMIGKEFEKQKISVANPSFFQRIFHTFAHPYKTVLNELRIRLGQPYSMHGITSQKLVHSLWARIMDFDLELRRTALQRFEEEVLESKAHCMNGFMTRMVNVLIGLDEHIQLKLEAREVLQNRIPVTMKTLREKHEWKEGEEPTLFYIECFKETCKDLDECEVNDAGNRREWLAPFFDVFVDELTTGYTDPDVDQPLLDFKQKYVHAQFEKYGLPNEDWAKAAMASNL